MAPTEETVHLRLSWEHPSSPGANASRTCHNRTAHRELGSGGGASRLPSRPRPGAGGNRGNAGVRGWRRGAGPQPGMSSEVRRVLPAGCIRRRAGPPPATPAARGPPGLPAALGLLGLGPRPRERRAPPRPRPARPPARPRPPYLRLQPARPQAASTPSGPARRGPTRPRPRSEEERRLRNLQPPPVPQPPASLPRPGRARYRRRTTNGSVDLQATRPPLAMGSTPSQSRAAWRREAGTWRRRRPRRGGAGGRGGSEPTVAAAAARRHLGSSRGAAAWSCGSSAVRKAPWKLEERSFVKAAVSLENSVLR